VTRRWRHCFYVLLLAWLAVPPWVHAADPNADFPAGVVTVTRDGYTVAGLATHAGGATQFKYGIALFPGHPGIMRLVAEGGEPRFEMRGNFLVRSRRHWLDAETLVLVIDAPSDQWSSFSQTFRATARYGADVGVLVDEAARRYGVEDWTFVGTSEGSVSAFHAARMNPQRVRRVILTASVFIPSRNGPALSDADFTRIAAPLLWVHHADDPCRFTPYRSARDYAQRTRSPLVTVRGGGPESGDPCHARTAHGFVGVERQTVQAMHAWIKTGKPAAEVSP
jgi:hypothetical protein